MFKEVNCYLIDLVLKFIKKLSNTNTLPYQKHYGPRGARGEEGSLGKE